MKLLIKTMVVFTTIYAVAAMVRNARISWPFAFLGTVLVSLLGIAGDRVLMPKMGRLTAVITDMVLIFGALFGAKKIMRTSDEKVTLPYLGIVSAALGGFEALFHEWVYDRERYEKLGDHEGGQVH